MMTENTDTINKAFDVLIGLNTAVKNIRLYPPGSASVVRALEKLYESLLVCLSEEPKIVFAESDHDLFINGHPFKDQKKPHVASLLGILTGSGLQSISFSAGLKKEALSSFVDLLSRTPEILKKEARQGSISSGLEHIRVLPAREGRSAVKPPETPGAAEDSGGKKAPADRVRRLAENLKSENRDTRESAAKQLADLLSWLPADRHGDLLVFISGNVLDWIQTESLVSDNYLKICGFLKNIIRHHLTQKQFSDASRYLEIFRCLAEDATLQSDDVKKTARQIIRELASPENIRILQNEMNTENHEQKTHAERIFAALGPTAVKRVLDQLRTANDSSERIRMMHLIAAAKEKALPLVAARIRGHEPWYYLRNMAYLLGRIGNEESARMLAPLLREENVKLRQEALKSIQKTGGNRRGALLLGALPQAGDDFKLSLVEALGRIKADAAVFPLLDLLKDRRFIPSAKRIDLEEKICTTLGAIGSPDAIPLLSEIAEAKSFLGYRSYPDRVKGAAARTLVILRRRVAES